MLKSCLYIAPRVGSERFPHERRAHSEPCGFGVGAVSGARCLTVCLAGVIADCLASGLAGVTADVCLADYCYICGVFADLLALAKRNLELRECFLLLFFNFSATTEVVGGFRRGESAARTSSSFAFSKISLSSENETITPSFLCGTPVQETGFRPRSPWILRKGKLTGALTKTTVSPCRPSTNPGYHPPNFTRSKGPPQRISPSKRSSKLGTCSRPSPSLLDQGNTTGITRAIGATRKSPSCLGPIPFCRRAWVTPVDSQQGVDGCIEGQHRKDQPKSSKWKTKMDKRTHQDLSQQSPKVKDIVSLLENDHKPARQRRTSSSSTISNSSFITSMTSNGTQLEAETTAQLIQKLRNIINGGTTTNNTQGKPKYRAYLKSDIACKANKLLDNLEFKIESLEARPQETSPNKKKDTKETGTSMEIADFPENHTNTPSLQPNKSTYAAIMRKPAPKKPQALLIYPSESSRGPGEIKELLRKEVAHPGIKIKDVRNIKNGVAIVCENSEDVTRLESTIKNSASLKDTIQSKQPAKRHPSIILYNLPEEISIDEINEALRSRAGISDDLKLRFKLTGRQPGTAHWVMEAPSDSFHKIKKLGKIPINWSMYQVREFFHIKRCNKCQGFRHLAKDCPKNRPVCGSCAGNHETRRCRSPQVVCINCAMHNQLHGTRNHPQTPRGASQIRAYLKFGHSTQGEQTPENLEYKIESLEARPQEPSPNNLKETKETGTNTEATDLPENITNAHKQQPNKISYAAIAKKQAPKNPPGPFKYTLSESSKGPEEIRELLKKEVAHPGVKIKEVRNIRNGVAVICDNPEDISQLETKIKNSNTLKETIHTKQPARRHPSIIIYNLPEEISLEEINEALKARAGITENLNLRFKLSGRTQGTAHWVMEAPSESFHKIRKLGRIPINWSMYQIKEFFHIKRCNKCQGFRHLAKDCPNTRPFCGSCAGHHETRKCRSPQSGLH
ncbi:putative 50 kDa protein in type I like protein [Argiope bruennichi]|uniref:Putative 50 kDa protein in type I like protein n=1 Tax=Argiope bruennichi TaxID=94029 RepID=A0A8T0EZE6_ARGBR|nr:putative 50 kDa protein in type I like protein [Argiope bruennichi]